MSAPLKRKLTRKVVPKRWPLNLQTLQMMVQSGVVRRADLAPPPVVTRPRFHVLDEVDRDLTAESVSEQGWLARVILRRKSPSPVSKRSQT